MVTLSDRSRRVRRALLALVLLLGAYLAFFPVSVDPEAWTPPKAPGLVGRFAPNDRLAGYTLLGRDLPGPEAIAFDREGRIVTGLLDGRIVRLENDGGVTTLGRTGGRPLGLKIAEDGSVVVADAHRGLLRVANGHVETLSTEQGGVPFGFADDVDFLPDGTLVFTDASSKRSVSEFEIEILEHRANGRLLRYDPGTGRTELVTDGLYFPNGVVVTPDGEHALVCETSNYRVLKIPLRGPRKGARDVWVSNLPGFCDNLTYSAERGVYWIALGSPRDPGLDGIAPFPFLRRVVARLPPVLRPGPKRHAFAVAVRPDGSIADVLQDPSPRSFSPVTSVTERGGFLYLGSFRHPGIARVRAP